MSVTGKAPVILYADQEHSGIRLAIFLALFAGYFIGFQIVALLLQTFAPPSIVDYTTFLACVGAVPIALLLIWGLEKVLKRVWHSGLSITLDEQGIFIHDQRGGAAVEAPAAPAMTWAANMSRLNWYFRLSGYPRGGRERRIPVKWHCLATELQQDESRLSIYTFMPPEEAATWTDDPKQGFHIISPVEIYDNTMRSRIGPPSRPMIPNRLLQSKDGRYWLAERRRWEYGIELSPEDFTTLMSYATAADLSRPILAQS